MLLKTSSRIYGDAFILDCNGRITFGEETALLRQQVLTCCSNRATWF